MTLWIVGAGLLAAIGYGIFGLSYAGPWHSKSKYFPLHKVLIAPGKVSPEFFATIEANIPTNAIPGFLTYVPKKVAEKLGLQGHEIVGFLKQYQRAWTPENFVANAVFKSKVHEIAAKEIPATILERAKALRSGEIQLIDDRWTGSADDVPAIHCLGIYHVENGAVSRYSPNPEFAIFSGVGPIELVESIRQILYSEIPTS